MAFGHFLFGSHTFMVTALGLCGPVITLDEFGGVLGRWPLDTFFGALTVVSWARLLACVGSGP